jgi:Zn-dependent protease
MQDEDVSLMKHLFPMISVYFLYILGLPLWGVVIMIIWYTSLVYLENNGTLDDWNATRMLGFILMIRTNKGRVFLDKISRYGRFWRGFGEFSIWLCFVVMFGVMLLLLFSALMTALSPPQESIPAKDLLLIPGITSSIPFRWPTIALIIAVIIHEYGHAIQARVHGMRAKSFGLLLLGPLPMGAFFEPEFEEMTRAPRRERLRIYAAAPSINIVATYFVLLLISVTASGFVATNPGMHAQKIVASSGADEAGLEPYEIITHMDGMWVPDYDSFELVMESKSPGDTVEISVLSRENELGEREARRITVTLTNQLDYYLEQGIPSYFEDECEEEEDCLEKYTNKLNELGIKDGDAFLGVHGFYSGTEAVDRYELSYSSGSFTRAMNFLFKPLVMMGTPIQLEGHTIPLDERNLLDAGDGLVTSIIGTEGLLAVFDFLFWFAWINFLLGFANLIPMVPFDGGQIARDSAHSVIRFFARDMNPLRVESLANRISGLSSIIMLIIILLPILVANILN